MRARKHRAVLPQTRGNQHLPPAACSVQGLVWRSWLLLFMKRCRFNTQQHTGTAGSSSWVPRAQSRVEVWRSACSPVADGRGVDVVDEVKQDGVPAHHSPIDLWGRAAGKAKLS